MDVINHPWTNRNIPLYFIIIFNIVQVPSNEDSLHFLNSSPFSAVYMRRWTGSALVQVMAWFRTNAGLL